MAKKPKKKISANDIAVNRKATHDYFIEERIEAGVSLLGWEVKSLRQGRVQLADSHIIFKRGEAFLLGAHISPMESASTHVNTDPQRTRKLLLHRKEISKLIGHVDRKGYTIVPLRLYWHHRKVKCELALAKGKKQFDKRASIKDREWQRDKARALKQR